MDVEYANARDEELFHSQKKLVRRFGFESAREIMRRITELEHIEVLADIPPYPPPRRHKLVGRNEEYAVCLKHPFRLVFTPAGQSANERDMRKIKCVRILRVEDYHGN